MRTPHDYYNSPVEILFSSSCTRAVVATTTYAALDIVTILYFNTFKYGGGVFLPSVRVHGKFCSVLACESYNIIITNYEYYNFV